MHDQLLCPRSLKLVLVSVFFVIFFNEMSFAQQKSTTVLTLSQEGDFNYILNEEVIYKLFGLESGLEELDTVYLEKQPKVGAITQNGTSISEGLPINFKNSFFKYSVSYGLIQDTFAIRMEDTQVTSGSVHTFYVQVDSANHKLSYSELEIDLEEDSALELNPEDLIATVADQIDTEEIVILTLPNKGNLLSEGVKVESSDTISIFNLNYIPETNYFGQDSFTWSIPYFSPDTHGSVNLAIQTVNDLPFIIEDELEIEANEDESMLFNTIDFLNLFSDVEDEIPTKIIIETVPVNGDLVLSGVNSEYIVSGQELTPEKAREMEYVPSQDYNGLDSLSFSFVDSEGAATDKIKMSIAILPVNDPPSTPVFMAEDTISVPFDTTSVIFKWQSSIDIENDSVYYRINFKSLVDEVVLETNDTSKVIKDWSSFLFDSYEVYVEAYDGKEASRSRSIRVLLDEVSTVSSNRKSDFSDYLKIWPNPVRSGIVNISSDLHFGKGEYNIEVYSSVGQIVFARTLRDTNLTDGLRLQLNELKEGAYYLKIYAKNYTACRQLTIKPH